MKGKTFPVRYRVFAEYRKNEYDKDKTLLSEKAENSTIANIIIESYLRDLEYFRPDVWKIQITEKEYQSAN